MGISAEAVRQRIKRETIRTEKDPDGTVRVLLVADSTRTNDRTDDRTNSDSTHTNDRTDGGGATDPAPLMAHLHHLEQEVEFLRAELRHREEDHREETRRKDHIIAAALKRIPPQLTAPHAPPQSPQANGDGTDGSRHPEDDDTQGGGERRSWWRRWFGFE
jgi:hypothetical protein